MFWPSDQALAHLSDALSALQTPEKLFENYGLIERDEYLTYDDNDIPYHRKPSWQEVKRELEQARDHKSEQLRKLCSYVLRRRNDEDWHLEQPLDQCPRARFQDPMDRFETQLPDDGYRFDGLEIRGSRPVPSVAQRADEALSNALRSDEFPECGKLREHVAAAVQLLSEDKYEASLTKLRSALQHCLKTIAGELATQQGGTAPSFKEDWEVRQYLEQKGFFTREEKKGFDGIYGLLSSGAHGKGDKNHALLGYVACVMACLFAITRFQDLRANKTI